MGPLIALPNRKTSHESLYRNRNTSGERPMKRSTRALLATLLVITPLLANCADNRDPSSPEIPVTVQPQNGLLGGLLGAVGSLLSGVLNILGGADANGSAVYAWIGSDGGTIKTAAYTVVVPRGAVSKSTKFSLTPTNTGMYVTDLKAEQQGLLGLVSVGEKGFAKPIQYTVSYAKATGSFDPKKLVIVYLRSDGKAEITATTIDTKTKTVTGSLQHFSKYALVEN
jgi:hypothetical protein